MEKQDLITRERQTDDRRVVKTRVTAKGLDILKRLDSPVRDMHKRQFQHMTSAQLKSLVDLLEAVHHREEESVQE
jgi:DNA-binding MarR family transcriptional regulator